MKRAVCAAALAAAMGLSAATPAMMPKGGPTNVVHLTKQEYAAIVAKNGGFIRKPGTGLGRILILNAQGRVPSERLSGPVEYLRKYTKLPIELKDGGKVALPLTREAVRASGANMMVAVVETDAKASPLLVSPDEAWAVVDVAPLGADKPDGKVLEFRLRKEVSRAFAFLCGGVNSQFDRTPVSHCSSLKDLDFIDMDQVPADLIQRFKSYVAGYGVTPYTISTYKAACKKGWAPAPTNDVQKAIWEEVRSIPAKPLRIEYDPKRGK